MKATGVVRRVDDLGRIVIPKEIRRTMHIRDGEPMEIFTDAGGSVIFRKYSPMGELSEVAGQMADSLAKEAERPCVICDRDAVIASAGIRAEGKKLTAEVERLVEQRRLWQGDGVSLWEGGPPMGLLAPVITGGDLSGCVALLGDKKTRDNEASLARMAAGFLARQMES